MKGQRLAPHGKPPVTGPVRFTPPLERDPVKLRMHEVTCGRYCPYDWPERCPAYHAIEAVEQALPLPQGRHRRT